MSKTTTKKKQTKKKTEIKVTIVVISVCFKMTVFSFSDSAC